MKYKKIRAALRDDKLVLFRIFLIDETMSLMEFAYVLEQMFRMEDCHLFRFEQGRRTFMPSKWTEDSPSEDLEDISWEDLGKKFRFVYDFGDWWEFEIFIYKKEESRDDSRRVILLDGMGAGIWEDDHNAFDHYLIDLNLPDEEPFDKDWLPWNLQDLHSIKDTRYFDCRAAQEAMDEFIESDLAARVAQLTDAALGDPELFSHYNAIVDHFMKLDRNDPRLYELAENAFELFINACDTLNEHGALPEYMGEMMGAENGPDNIMCLLQELPDAFMDAGKFEELTVRMEQLRSLFASDHVLAGFVDGIIFECLLATKQFDAARDLIEEWKDVYPDAAVIPAARIHLLTSEGNLKEAEELLKQNFDENMECNEDTYPLFRAAYSLYALTDPKKAGEISRILNEYDQNQADLPEEYDNFTEASDELQFAISRFVKHKSRERYSLACACFVMLCQDDGDIVMHVVNQHVPDQTMPLIITSDKQEEFIVVYSTFDAAHERAYYLDTPFPVLDSVELALSAGLEGIVVDPDPEGNGLFIHADTLAEIKRVLNEKEAADHHTLFLS